MQNARPVTPPEISVIVPARNEEASLFDCLHSLVRQDEVNFEILVIDDHSTDRTRQIAESVSQVRVIAARELPAGWTGKNNAVWMGAQQARGEWLLFTDADTVHLPGSLARALAEAQKYDVDMLSYSPEQVAVTFPEMAALPVIFAELAREFPPKEVSDPASPVAAANGQYILMRRAAYMAVGGHRAVASDLLEDVALARLIKRSGRKLRFRYGADAVRTRMYRSFAQLRDGWTKNLASLFPGSMAHAAILMVWWLAAWITFPFPILAIALYLRIARANFGIVATLVSTAAGVPVFSYLLLRSKIAHARGVLLWKGRGYSGKESARDEVTEPIAAGGVS